jgi:hypothetical protein
MSIRTTIVQAQILPAVRPYGYPPRTYTQSSGAQEPIHYRTHGHEFDFAVDLNFWSHGIFGRDTTLNFNEDQLTWGERIRWYEPRPYTNNPGPNDLWVMKGEDIVDFADAQHRYNVMTVLIGWFGDDTSRPGWFLPWEQRRWRDVNETLVAYANPVPHLGQPTQANRQQMQFEFTRWLVQNQNGDLTTILTDRPGVTKKCTLDNGSWQRSGGGGMATLNRWTRRRIVHFTLAAGNIQQTATQILETVNGNPTLCKFIIPGLTFQESEDPIRLATYRGQLDTANANNNANIAK